MLRINEDKFYNILDRYEDKECDVPEDMYYPSVDEIREHLNCRNRQETEDVVDYLVFLSNDPYKNIEGLKNDENYKDTLNFIDHVLKHDIELVA